MAIVHELVERGIRAYVEGRLSEATRLLAEALRLDPANSRARSYLLLLPGGLDAGFFAAPPAPAVAAPSPVAPLPAEPPTAEPALAAPPPAEPAAAEPPPAEPALAAPPPAEPAAAQPPPVRAAPPARAEPLYAPSPWDDGPASAPSIVLGADGGLNLDAVAETSGLRTLVPQAAGRASPKQDVAVWMTAAKDLLALGDFSGSLEMIEKILKVDPEHAEARAYLDKNESTLVAMYESKLGPLGLVPRLAIKPEEVMWLNLDHRAGFLLSQIDGTVDYESLFALSGLPRLDTARILSALLLDGVIGA